MIRVLHITEDLPFVKIEFVTESKKIQGEIVVSHKEFKENINNLNAFIIEQINRDVNQ